MIRPPKKGPGVSLVEFVKLLIDSKMEEVHTLMPGRVVKFYPDTHCVDVQPLLKEPIFDELQNRINPDSYPVLPDVPIRYPGGGGFMVTFPLSEGDTGMLEFCEASISGWLNTDEENEPEDIARHNVSHATFSPDLWSRKDITAAVAAAVMVLGCRESGQQVRITSGTVEACAVSDEGADDFVAMAVKVLTELNDIRTKFDTHTHTHPMGPTGTPITPMGSATPVASLNLKAN